jgi:predicted RND superfamily exporter protein
LLRRGAWLWAIALALAVPATWRTAQLYAHLRSELEQLLPRTAPSVLALDELRARMPGLQHLGVLVDAGDAGNMQAAERLVDDLAARVRAYPRELVSAVRTGQSEEREFLEAHAPLYMDVSDLQTVKERLEERRDWEASKAQGYMLEDDAPPPALDFGDLRKKYEQRTSATKRFDDDRFANRQQHVVLMLIEVGALHTPKASGAVLLGRVKSDLASLRPETYAPGLRVGFTSEIAINVEETGALVADLAFSSVVVALLVVGVIVLYFEWWKSIVILLPPLLLATVFSFALASLPPFRVTELNSNTAFLGSIIVGNGINFGIVLLARYVEERRRGGSSRDALVTAVQGARTGTLSAALAAGVSYASLALTDFRGFRQFGFIGGIGMVLSWVLAFVLMPPLAHWIDREPALPHPRVSLMTPLSAFLRERRALVVAVVAALALGAAWEVRSFGSSQIETDFSKLRRADTWKNGEGYWGRKMDALLGSYVTPTVILADDEEQARAIARAVSRERASEPLSQMVATVRTLDDVVPLDQEAKLALTADIRDDLTPRIRATLTDTQRADVDRFLGSETLSAFTAADVPETFTAGLRERDGTVGRAVLVFPKPGRLLWEGPTLAEFVTRLRRAAATTVRPGAKPGRLAGGHALSNDILDSVRRDGVLASAAAFAGVVAVVLFLLRGTWSTVLVLGSLLLGVLFLAAGAMALGIKINFANFIAYPITFGIGVDYAVNVASRWELEGRRAMANVVQTTGGAVALCSLTTIIGYSSLLLAQNRALFLFGLLAVIGEVACLSTAILALPAVVEWVSGRGAKQAR